MSRLAQFRLPDLGEGLTEGEILQWLVQVGDTVRLNQPIVEVETAKAAVEVPSPYAGVVAQLHHAAGETVDVGSPIITIDTEPSAGPLPAADPGGPGSEASAIAAGAAGAAAGAAANPVESAAPRQVAAAGTHGEVAADTVPAPAAALVDRPPREGAVEPGLVGGPAPGAGALIGETGANGRTATLVGYGPRTVTAKRRPRKGTAARDEPRPAPARVAAGQVGEAAAVRVGRPAGGVTVLAKPPVRKLAKELGVDLSVLLGTGPRGSITRDDVQTAAATATSAPSVTATAPAPAAAPLQREPAGTSEPEAPAGLAAGTDAAAADRRARERRIPVKGVRRLTAAAMVGSAFTAPHVTEFLTLDVTPTLELRERVAARPEFRDVKVTPLLFVAKALLLAVRRHPEINSTFHEDEIVVKDYVNLGIAAATPRGLVVPNIKDADRLDLLGLARALQDLTRTAKEGRTLPSDMQHGTITITNVGMFGVDNGTPILNPGESAILCFGAVRPMPWVHEGELAVRQVTQLSLSFDHRNIDGQLGSQFLADIGRVLSDPVNALLL